MNPKEMAACMWDAYVKEPEPEKRRIYGLRYVFWADLRDSRLMEEEECESSGS